MNHLTSIPNGITATFNQKETDTFLHDVLKGLSAKDKYLQSKYFYDATGDKLFQKIMQTEEYYLTRCEMEIFTNQTRELAETVTDRFNEFDIVELGAGDATKSIHLLKELFQSNASFTYFPVDISANVINLLNKKIPATLPLLHIEGLNGEYLQMLDKAKTLSGKKKVVLFLGSNIGNVPADQAIEFCSSLRSHLLPGDLLLIGFDLKKDPSTILAAYNDKQGITAAFNLNLLDRINDELGGDFRTENYYHYPTYDPATGTCKSYLVSMQSQQVHIHSQVFRFAEGEPVFTEISQKYTPEQTDVIAKASGFKTVRHFYDSRCWFLDATWEVV